MGKIYPSIWSLHDGVLSPNYRRRPTDGCGLAQASASDIIRTVAHAPVPHSSPHRADRNLPHTPCRKYGRKLTGRKKGANNNNNSKDDGRARHVPTLRGTLLRHGPCVNRLPSRSISTDPPILAACRGGLTDERRRSRQYRSGATIQRKASPLGERGDRPDALPRVRREQQQPRNRCRKVRSNCWSGSGGGWRSSSAKQRERRSMGKAEV